MQNVLKSKMFIGALAAVAIVAATVVIALNVGHSGNDLQTQLDLGNKYVSELDYENAIIAYEEALEIDPYCLEAYLGLYDAYLALGQQDKAIEIMEQAKNMLPDSVEVYVSLAQLYASQNQIGLVVSTLEEGIEVTNSDRLREMLREYQHEPEDGQMERVENSPSNEPGSEEELPSEETEETSVAIGFRPDEQQQAIIPVLTVTNEGEEVVEIPLTTPIAPPVQNNNTEGSSGDGGGSHGGGSSSGNTTVTRTGIAGNIYGINGQGIEGVTITVYPEQGIEPIEVSTDAIGSYLQELPVGNYRVVLSKEGYAELSTSVAVSRDNLTSNSYIILTEEESRQTASVEGIVVDATDSSGIGSAWMVFMKGFDQNPDEDPDVLLGNVHASTGDDGHFILHGGLPTGYYTFQVVKDGYTTYRHNETVKPGENEYAINMSPTIQAQGVYRIVLTWGETPRDLDSHLICTGNKNYHIYYGMKDQTYMDVGSDMIGHVVEYASLDVDDTSSYGPETITVKIGEGNSYTYAVHNFTNSGAMPGQSGAWNLSSSGAKVMVYADEGLIFDGNVPVNEQGTTWEVFRIENGQLVVTNKVSFDYPGTAANGRSADEPMALSDETGKDDMDMPDENAVEMSTFSNVAQTETIVEPEEQLEEEEMEPVPTGNEENTVLEDAAELDESMEPQEREAEESIESEEIETEENTVLVETEAGEDIKPEETEMGENTVLAETKEGESIKPEGNDMDKASEPEENGTEEETEPKEDAAQDSPAIQAAEAEKGAVSQEPQADGATKQEGTEPEGEAGQSAEKNIG